MQEPLLVELAEIARLQEAIHQGLCGRCGLLVISAENVRALHEALAVLGELYLDAGQRHTDRAELRPTEDIERRRPASLGLAVIIGDNDVEAREEVEDLLCDRCGAAHEDASTSEPNGALQLR